MAEYGRGKKFNFHGKFRSKAAAVRKERTIDGGFILKVKNYYYVLSRKD